AVAVPLLGLIVAGLLIVLALQNRGRVARWLRGRPAKGRSGTVRVVREGLADAWPALAVLYVLAVYGIWALGMPDAFEFILRASLVSLAVIVGARLVALGLRMV